MSTLVFPRCPWEAAGPAGTDAAFLAWGLSFWCVLRSNVLVSLLLNPQS